MAVSDFDLDVSDVLPLLPFDTTSISANSRVSTSDITAYIEDGASRVEGALDKAGLTASGLSDDAKRHCQSAIKAYAAAQAIAKLGYSGPVYDNLIRRYDDELAVLRNRPQVLADKATRTVSNIDTTTYSTAKAKRVYNRDYEW